MSDNVEFKELTERLKTYVATNLEIIKLEVFERTSVLGASFISSLLLGLSGLLFVLFLSLGVGFYLSTLFGDTYTGFAILAGFYLLIVVILLIGRKKAIERPQRDRIIRMLLNKREE